MLARTLLLAATTLPLIAASPLPPGCPAPNAGVMVRHLPLNVNPDGATGSYTPGDHGYTYIANGLNLVEQGKTFGCFKKKNRSRCDRLFRAAETGGFGPGTATFCVYAMEVEAFAPGRPAPECGKPKSGRRLIGDGRGKLRLGASLPTVAGGMAPTYVSTTSLTHTVAGNRTYLDSAAIPVLVAPTSDLLGAVVWARLGAHATFAIVGDVGPALGEGSVALHQLLRYGAVQPPQPLGPIPAARRCGPAESGLRAPFVSFPDGGRSDRCRTGRTATSPADIRGYANIDQAVDLVVLSRVKPSRSGRRVLQDVTPAMLESLAGEHGLSRDRLSQLADCPTSG